jgi:hypothetical protein
MLGNMTWLSTWIFAWKLKPALGTLYTGTERDYRLRVVVRGEMLAQNRESVKEKANNGGVHFKHPHCSVTKRQTLSILPSRSWTLVPSTVLSSVSIAIVIYSSSVSAA